MYGWIYEHKMQLLLFQKNQHDIKLKNQKNSSSALSKLLVHHDDSLLTSSEALERLRQ
jgi:hypothetical protein